MADWNKTVLETLDAVVDLSTNKIVRPAHKAARAGVYGLVIAALLLIVLFFLVIAAFRATAIALPMYGVYLVWGTIFFTLGAVAWAKK